MRFFSSKTVRSKKCLIGTRRTNRIVSFFNIVSPDCSSNFIRQLMHARDIKRRHTGISLGYTKRLRRTADTPFDQMSNQLKKDSLGIKTIPIEMGAELLALHKTQAHAISIAFFALFRRFHNFKACLLFLRSLLIYHSYHSLLHPPLPVALNRLIHLWPEYLFAFQMTGNRLMASAGGHNVVQEKDCNANETRNGLPHNHESHHSVACHELLTSVCAHVITPFVYWPAKR